MDTSLRALLITKNKVHEDTAKWLETQGCLTIANFANWVDAKAEIKEAIHSKIASMKDNAADLAKTKQAWREADATVSRGVKRAAEGLDNEALDDPLHDEIFKAINASFRQYYNWAESFDSRRIGCDSLHGRFWREFDRKQPSMFSILKARSLAKSTKEQQVKKTKVGNLEIHQIEKEFSDGPASLSKWLACFDIVVNTWAVVGCMDVDFQGKTRKYIHWAEAQSYMFEFTIKSNELKDKRHQDLSIFKYLTAVEEEFRSKAVELARGEQEIPWGEALKQAVACNSNIWNEKRDLLERQWQHHGPQPKMDAYQGQPPHFIPCNKFNAGNCNLPTCRFHHICNVKLASGGYCHSRGHGASHHDDNKHGARARDGKEGGKDRQGKGKGKKGRK